jgi:hypothetical protein
VLAAGAGAPSQCLQAAPRDANAPCRGDPDTEPRWAPSSHFLASHLSLQRPPALLCPATLAAPTLADDAAALLWRWHKLLGPVCNVQVDGCELLQQGDHLLDDAGADACRGGGGGGRVGWEWPWEATAAEAWVSCCHPTAAAAAQAAEEASWLASHPDC